MNIIEIKENKKQFLPLLLLGDEQEEMIDKYLDRGRMFALYEDGEAKCICVVTDEGNGIIEVKNIATKQDSQRKGYGKAMLQYVEDTFKGDFSVIQLGTGDSPLTIPFYEKCGFVRSHVIKNFYVDNYDHPIYEAGIKLVDMIYLKKNI